VWSARYIGVPAGDCQGEGGGRWAAKAGVPAAGAGARGAVTQEVWLQYRVMQERYMGYCTPAVQRQLGCGTGLVLSICSTVLADAQQAR
jgi:hypothetical protein